MKKKMDPVIGQKIVEIRAMTAEEMENEGWEATPYNAPFVLVLENGVKLFPSQDPEGNGPGCLFGSTKDGTGFWVEK